MDPFSGIVQFVHVAEERSFRRAAERLGVTTAAVSKAVSKLETELGVALLERTSRSVALTDEGAAFLERCRDAVDAVRAGRELVAQARGTVAGRLRVTVSPILSRLLISELGRLLTRHPRLSLQISVTDRVARLVEEEIDVAIRMGELDDSSLVSRVLHTPRWTTVASPAYLARRGTPKTLDELARHERLVFLLPRGKPRAWAFTEGSLDAPAAVLVDQGDLLVDGALAGLGVAQVLDFMVQTHVREGRLLEVLPELAVAGPTIHAVCSPRRRGIPRVRAFLDLLGDLFARRADLRRG